MIKDIVLQHRAEKEKFLTQNYVFREQLPLVRQFLNQDIIKVISGPRRAGKSIFCFLLLKDINFAYLNFDDDNLLKAQNSDQILQAVLEVYPQAKFILFDEIQNLKNWELFVNKLQRRGYNLIITGSNANLLSQELATALTGRHLALEVLPFSFREFLKARDFEVGEAEINIPENKARLLNYLHQYLQTGGFPEPLIKNLELKNYLETLFDSILFKDVVKRYNLRFSQKIYDLAVYLITNFASQFSFTKLKNILGFRSVLTVQNYVSYLEEAFLIFVLQRFSFKLKEQIKSPKKVYIIDNGLITAKAFQISPNLGKMMENLVFIELLRKNYKINQELFCYQTAGSQEVDFIIKQGLKITQLIQVCYNLSDEQTKTREIRSLLKASEELKCNNLLIITNDYEADLPAEAFAKAGEKIDGKKIKFIPLWKWLIQSKILKVKSK